MVDGSDVEGPEDWIALGILAFGVTGMFYAKSVDQDELEARYSQTEHVKGYVETFDKDTNTITLTADSGLEYSINILDSENKGDTPALIARLNEGEIVCFPANNIGKDERGYHKIGKETDFSDENLAYNNFGGTKLASRIRTGNGCNLL